MIGFLPFKTAGDALNNINAVSEGIVTDELKLFIQTNMPKVTRFLRGLLGLAKLYVEGGIVAAGE